MIECGSEESRSGTVPSDPVALHDWVNSLRKCHPEGFFDICLETSRGPLIEVLRCYDYIHIFPVNPITASRFRESMYPSLCKDDSMDAALLLDILDKHISKLHQLKTVAPEMRRLEGYTQARRRLVERRTSLLQSLIQMLKSYYPQALQLAGDLSKPMARAFLKNWPSWQHVRKVKPLTLRKFYYANQSRSESIIQQRLQLLSSSRPLTEDAITLELGMSEMLALVDQLSALARLIDDYDDKIENAYSKIKQRQIFDSLPGAGKALAPRLAVAMGCYGVHCNNAEEFSAYTGIAPVRQTSGKMSRVGKRHRVPKFLHQTFIDFAHWSVIHCPWAKAYYQKRRLEKKHGHWAILRAVAFKWIRIIFRCWQDGIPYSEEKYRSAVASRKATT